MNSPYISIDIETTGLDPERHQVLEIAAVYNQQEVDVMWCPFFCGIIDPGEIVGDPVALNMNARIIERIARDLGDPPRIVIEGLMDWVSDIQDAFDTKKFHLIGKNIGQFDLQFLKRMPGWDEDYFSYRHLEVGSLYTTPEGISGQSDLLNAVATDAKIKGSPHETLYDARVSLELARQFWQDNLGWDARRCEYTALCQSIEKSKETA